MEINLSLKGRWVLPLTLVVDVEAVFKTYLSHQLRALLFFIVTEKTKQLVYSVYSSFRRLKTFQVLVSNNGCYHETFSWNQYILLNSDLYNV